jgi:hypothetical protein
MPPPGRPKIYHIVHVDRLTSIVSSDGLFCDRRARQQADGTVIGMSEIKDRRLTLPVSCHLGTFVGDYVPFYFCSRSIMLFVIHRANNPGLTYRGGQQPIIHLEADLHKTIAWADANKRRWAFSLSNAGARYARFCSNVDDLGEINWQAVAATDFRQPDIAEGKQAEFLIQDFPWALVDRIGVFSREVALRVGMAMMGATHRPVVEIRRCWYY